MPQIDPTTITGLSGYPTISIGNINLERNTGVQWHSISDRLRHMQNIPPKHQRIDIIHSSSWLIFVVVWIKMVLIGP